MSSEAPYIPPTSVATPDAVRALPESTPDVLVQVLDDDMVLALTRLPHLRVLSQSGNSSITDAGIRVLATLTSLEELDLEWSDRLTDDALDVLATLPRLRWVDLSFCFGVTDAGLARLRRARPELKIEVERPLP